MKLSANTVLRLATLAAFLGLAACGPDYDHTDLSVVGSSYTAGPNEASLSKITLTEGSAMTVHLVVYNDDNEKMPTRFQVTDNTVINFIGGVDVDNYTIISLKQGHSQIQLIADDEKVVTINVDVVAQPAPP